MNPQQLSKFFDAARASTLFAGSLSQRQVDGMQAILDQVGSGITNSVEARNQLAYILATVYREVRKDMYPVREGFVSTDAAAIAHVTDMYNRHIISHNYSLPDKVTGKSYFGRGQVQITWADNYQRIGKLIGVDLYNHPELALTPEVSAKIAVKGMQGGWFTGHKLSEYIKGTTTDFVGARRIINGQDVATLIAGNATKFQDIINKVLS